MMTPELLLGLNQRAGWVPLHVARRAVEIARGHAETSEESWEGMLTARAELDKMIKNARESDPARWAAFVARRAAPPERKTA